MTDGASPSLLQRFRELGAGVRVAPGEGRGVVTSAGGLPLVANAYVGLKRLRTVSDLPVEWFHVGDAEVPAPLRALLARDLGGLEFRALQGPRGFAVKPFSLLSSRFRQALWLDADNALLGDPEPLFAEPALFWPDVDRFTRDELYEEFGLPPAWNREGPEFESGQMVLDRERHAEALAAVCALHAEDLRPAVYALTHGDKDTFRLAFRLVGARYRLVETPAVPFGVPGLRWSWRGRDFRLPHRRGAFMGTGLLQHDLAGSPLFVHRTVLAWNPYRACAVSTHVAGRPAPWLARVEEEDLEHLSRFRRDYLRYFPTDLREWAEAIGIRLLRLVCGG